MNVFAKSPVLVVSVVRPVFPSFIFSSGLRCSCCRCSCGGSCSSSCCGCSSGCWCCCCCCCCFGWQRGWRWQSGFPHFIFFAPNFTAPRTTNLIAPILRPTKLTIDHSSKNQSASKTSCGVKLHFWYREKWDVLFMILPSTLEIIWVQINLIFP